MRTPLYRPREGSIPTLGVPSLDGVGSIHLIGIGGAGMRNLARLLLARGVRVSGSDLKDSDDLRELATAGATVRVGHDAAALGDPDVVVISTAIATTNPEREAAVARGIPCGHASRRSPRSRTRIARSPWPGRPGRPPPRR